MTTSKYQAGTIPTVVLSGVAMAIPVIYLAELSVQAWYSPLPLWMKSLTSIYVFLCGLLITFVISVLLRRRRVR